MTTETAPTVFCRFTEMRPTVTLVEHPQNPNTHPQNQLERLAEVIRGNGWRQPITVSDRSGYITKGHGRYQAAKLAGFHEVPVEVQHYDNEAAELADMLADNRIAELAEIDNEALNAAITQLQTEDPDALPLAGFTEEELAELRAGLESLNTGTEAVTDPDEVPDEEEVPNITQPGDVWYLGKHRLICGDSTLPSTYEALLQGEQPDLMVTDPPYNVNYGEKNRQASAHDGWDRVLDDIANDNMSDEEFFTFLAEFYVAAMNSLKPGAAFYIWHADSEGLNFRKALKEAGGLLKQTLIWNKNRMILGRQDYQWKHEPCLYGWKPGASHHWHSDRCQTTVIDCDAPSANKLHATMKPVQLFEYLVRNSSAPEEIVLDPFGGSGTTAMACEAANRRARLIELNTKYCDVIAKRFHDAFPAEEVYLMRDGQRLDPDLGADAEAEEDSEQD